MKTSKPRELLSFSIKKSHQGDESKERPLDKITSKPKQLNNELFYWSTLADVMNFCCRRAISRLISRRKRSYLIAISIPSCLYSFISWLSYCSSCGRRNNGHCNSFQGHFFRSPMRRVKRKRMYWFATCVIYPWQ